MCSAEQWNLSLDAYHPSELRATICGFLTVPVPFLLSIGTHTQPKHLETRGQEGEDALPLPWTFVGESGSVTLQVTPGAHFNRDSFTTHGLRNYSLSIHNQCENDLLSLQSLGEWFKKKSFSPESELGSLLAPAFLTVTGNLDHRLLGPDAVWEQQARKAKKKIFLLAPRNACAVNSHLPNTQATEPACTKT